MRVTVDGIQFEVKDQGSGLVVLLLHGFPDSAKLWKHQIPVLVQSGYRVVTPDLKGFGESDKPQQVELYALPNLLKDVLGILDQLHITKFKGISERALQRNDWALLRQLWFADDPQVATDYIADLSRPGALTSALNWYRANVQLEQFGDTKPRPAPLLRCPVMGIWSCRDQGVLEEQMKASARYVEQGLWRYHQIKDAGHWIPRDAPQELNNLLLDFLKSTVVSKL